MRTTTAFASEETRKFLREHPNGYFPVKKDRDRSSRDISRTTLKRK